MHLENLLNLDKKKNYKGNKVYITYMGNKICTLETNHVILVIISGLLFTRNKTMSEKAARLHH